MRRLDIGSRVLIAALVPAVIIAVALAWYFTTTRIVDLENNLRDRGVLLVRQLASASELGLSSGNDAILRQAVDSVAAETGVEAVSVIDARF